MPNITESAELGIRNAVHCHPERSRGVWVRCKHTTRSQPDVSTPPCFARHDKRTVGHKSHAAFTLVELLVVIAIIALLLAILLPALQRVAKQS